MRFSNYTILLLVPVKIQKLKGHMLECIQRLSNHTGATLGVTVDP